MQEQLSTEKSEFRGPLAGLIRFCLNNRIIVLIVCIGVVLAGISVAPFAWDINWLPRSPVAVDAIPDIGENQQIVFTEWPGRSPQDIQDQITYPLTTVLLGMADVKSVRSNSMFGFSSIFIIFNEKADFDWSRAKVIERLDSLPVGALPEGVTPRLGPDATGLGQIFWYTLEGRDSEGNPAGGWDLDELRGIQDWTVRYALQSASGVAEAASVGGFVKEYQVDVDPDAMYAAGVSILDVYKAVRASNRDVGARTVEINNVEYLIRGLGFIKSIEDIEQTVVKVEANVPIRIKDIAHVTTGPALRTGVLDKGGAEAVGGVVTVRYGENPLRAIRNVKAKIKEIAPGLPQKTLPDGTVSKVTIVPFYDRTGLIYETLGTLNDAIAQEILITIIVVILVLRNLRSSVLISGLLPLAVLMSFLCMKFFKVDANIVALSGIAIAIGTMVDMGIVISENIVRNIELFPQESRLKVIYRGANEVGGAVLTAISTTVVGFMPVFTMSGAEGKLFKPLAYTKTFALIASVLIALLILPPAAYYLFHRKSNKPVLPVKKQRHWIDYLLVLILVVLLARQWMPLGPDRGTILNALWVAVVTIGLLLVFMLIQRFYEPMLGWCLRNKGKFLLLPAALVAFGFWAWSTIGNEFMPSLDEGSFLYMPTTMPHVSIDEATGMLSRMDAAIASVPEVESVVGKIGRADSPLDPAPISMFETVINYRPKYKTDRNGRYVLDDKGDAIRQWREGIETPRDIWQEIVKAAQMPGVTSAPRLQPIETRIVMLQTGMRAPMGVKVKGPDLKTIEEAGLQIEEFLKQVPGINPDTVFADRIVAKPYLEIKIDREAIARYGLRIDDVQNVVETAVGGNPITTTIEGRERYKVRVRYLRELRDEIETISKILVPTMGQAQVPLGQLATIEYKPGPQMIKSEESFLVSYVIFDSKPGIAEVDVVNQAREYLKKDIESEKLVLPAGVSYKFSGTYENQVHAERTMRVVVPVTLAIIVLIIYLQFKHFGWSMLVFTTVLTAWSGGFVWLWLYRQPWFLNVFNLREMFNISPYNLSVAVWVGFLALFGIASDSGVLMMTYLTERFKNQKPGSIETIRQETITAAARRVRPALMTSATTILALLPILTSTGRGSDIMVPMAIPSFGGMTLSLVDLLMVPVLFSFFQEKRIK